MDALEINELMENLLIKVQKILAVLKNYIKDGWLN